MPNTKSAEKAVRSSLKKKAHNDYWTIKYKASVKGIKETLNSSNGKEVLHDKLQAMQKILDKAAKEKVIHKNKANRLKSRYARKVSALSQTPGKTRKKS